MPKQDFTIIPKLKQEVSALFNVLFWLSLSLLFIGLAGFFILNTQVSSLREQEASLDDQIIELEQAELANLKKQIIPKARITSDVSNLFSDRQTTSKIFDLLRAVCHQQAQFSNFNFTTEENQVSIGLITESFKTLGEQVLILKANPVISNLSLASVHLAKEGVVDLALSFIIDKTFFSPEDL